MFVPYTRGECPWLSYGVPLGLEIFFHSAKWIRIDNGFPLIGEWTYMSPQQTIRIAMAQIVCLDGDREGNFVRIEHALKQATEQQAEIVCFPEMALLGWVNSDAHKRANPIPGPESGRLCKLAKYYDVYICIGIEEKVRDRLYNSVILISNEGEILLKHRKNNLLSELMTPPYTPGEEVNAVDSPIGKVGLLICADTFVEDNLNQMAKLHPDLLLVPYGWAEKEEAWPQHAKKMEEVIVNAARTVKTPVIGTNLVGEITKGPWAGRVFGGQSVAVNANGQVLARGCDRDKDIIIVDM